MKGSGKGSRKGLSKGLGKIRAGSGQDLGERSGKLQVMLDFEFRHSMILSKAS